MIKKIKIICVLFILIGIVLCPLSKVNAYSVELDPESLISLPFIITNGSGTVTISSSVTNYSLYYQAVEISNSVFSQIEKIDSDGRAELDTLEEEYTALRTEMNNLKEIYDKAKEDYQAGKDGDQSETLETACEQAKTNYTNKMNEYDAKIEEYNAKVDEINNNIKNLTPTYIEDKWIQSTDNKFSIDLTKFSGDQAFAVWIKLVTNDNKTYYDETTYTMTGTKKAEVSVTSVSLNKTTLSLEEGSNYTLTATISPSDATNKLVDWTSDNENVAKVENGKVTAISEGTATITVKTRDGNYTASCKVTVTKKAQSQNPSSTDNKNDKTNVDTPKEEKKDGTVVLGKLPQTGSAMTYIIVFSICVLSVIGIICYKKMKVYNFK